MQTWSLRNGAEHAMEMPQTVELVTAGMCFAVGIACCACGWRTMLGSLLRLGCACARYGVGSLANSFLPVRAGDAVRIVSSAGCGRDGVPR